MKVLIFSLIVVLAILHQDLWFWDTYEPLVFGFIPVGLAYHAGISIAASVLWGLAIIFCWPDDVEVLDEVPSAQSEEGGH